MALMKEFCQTYALMETADAESRLSQQGGKQAYRDMEQWLEIRQRVLREGASKRQILRETGMHWTTLEKILEYSCPPGYRRSKAPDKPKIGPCLERIRQILEQDKHATKKQRRSPKSIWHILQDEGFTGGYTIVKDAVRELRQTSRAVRRPLRRSSGGARFALLKDTRICK